MVSPCSFSLHRGPPKVCMVDFFGAKKCPPLCPAAPRPRSLGEDLRGGLGVLGGLQFVQQAQRLEQQGGTRQDSSNPLYAAIPTTPAKIRPSSLQLMLLYNFGCQGGAEDACASAALRVVCRLVGKMRSREARPGCRHRACLSDSECSQSRRLGGQPKKKTPNINFF